MEKGNNNNKTAAAVVWSHHLGRDNPLPAKQVHWAYWSIKKCSKKPLGILAEVSSVSAAGKTEWLVEIFVGEGGGSILHGADGNYRRFKTLARAKRVAEKNCELIARVQRRELAEGRRLICVARDNIAAHSKEAREKRAAAVSSKGARYTARLIKAGGVYGVWDCKEKQFCKDRGGVDVAKFHQWAVADLYAAERCVVAARRAEMARAAL